MSFPRRFAALLPPIVSFALACGSSDDSVTAQPVAAGASGTSGASGTAGAAGNATGGRAGASAGQSGAAGTGGKAGASGATGIAGTGGVAGQSGSGGAGVGGAGGGVLGCTADKECAAPFTTPAGCARALCDAATHACAYEAVDQDKDGFPTAVCKGANGESIKLGNDCDDSNASVRPGGWDGPKNGDKPDACGDGIDQDCSGVVDDGKTAKGATCVCTPNDVASCGEDASGKPVAFPTGKPVGECKLGSKTCLAAGTWGPCIGAVAPTAESCNGKDDNCDGATDEGPPPDAVYWLYDGDEDLHGAKGAGFEPVLACPALPPVDAPAGCTSRPLPCAQGNTVEACCPPARWKLAKAISANDCDDQFAGANPGEKEVCGDNRDNDCNGATDEGCTCTPGQMQGCRLTAGGQPITYPGGVVRAPCAEGKQTCVASGAGSAWGPCLDAIGPTSETCANPNVDNDCNGLVDDDPVDAITYLCDGDADGHLPAAPLTQRACELPQDGCKNWLLAGAKDDCADDDASRYAGAVETCGDGVDKNCDGNDSDGFGVGQPCDVIPPGAGSSALGACLKGGTTVCKGTAQTACKPLDETAPGSSRIGQSPAKYWQQSSSPNGSDDWNCDGTPEFSYAGFEPGTVSRTMVEACRTDQQICSAYDGYVACTGAHVVPPTSAAVPACCSCNIFTCAPSCYDPVGACGDNNFRVVHCHLTGGKCLTDFNTGSATLSCR